MSAIEILNYYRNLYYDEPQVTERGIVANAIDDVLGIINSQKEEIEQWQEEANSWQTLFCQETDDRGKIEAEAYKEFAERLENICKGIITQEWNEKAAPMSWSYAYENFMDDIDNLLKEMVGEEE